MQARLREYYGAYYSVPHQLIDEFDRDANHLYVIEDMQAWYAETAKFESKYKHLEVDNAKVASLKELLRQEKA